jgi:peptide/nickel transport system permease protein
MLTYIIRRLLHALLVLFLVSIAVFFMIRAMPGDPIEILYAQNTVAKLTPEDLAELRHEAGLDRPIVVQYADWISKLLQGDFGKSISRGFDIGEELGNRLTVTLILGLSSFIVGIIIGPLLGIISAIRRGKFIDDLVSVIANIGITAPQFWVAILLVFLFGLRLKLLPMYGYTLPWNNFGQSVLQSILPVFVGALSIIASTARQMRSSVLETLGEDYTRTAWAKGLNERKVVFRHVVKNSLMPVVTLSGTMLRMVIGGSVVVETIFVIPGLGKMMVDGMLSHDYPVVQATTLIMTLVVVLSSLVVDLLYGWLDPRIQYN